MSSLHRYPLSGHLGSAAKFSAGLVVLHSDQDFPSSLKSHSTQSLTKDARPPKIKSATTYLLDVHRAREQIESIIGFC